jgi:hypothetical protein
MLEKEEVLISWVKRNKRLFEKSCLESVRERTEKGFVVCRSDHEMQVGGTCEGTDCSVFLEDCGGKEQVATFHTHPGRSLPTLADVAFGGPYLIIGGILDRKLEVYRANTDHPSVRKLKEGSDRFNQTLEEYWEGLEGWAGLPMPPGVRRKLRALGRRLDKWKKKLTEMAGDWAPPSSYVELYSDDIWQGGT